MMPGTTSQASDPDLPQKAQLPHPRTLAPVSYLTLTGFISDCWLPGPSPQDHITESSGPVSFLGESAGR